MRERRRPGQLRTTRWRWYRRVLRGMRPDRNPLRRATDRLEAYLLAGLFVVAAAGAPFAAQAASQAAFTGALRVQHEQVAAWHQVRAVLLQTPGAAVGAMNTVVPALATWTSASGIRRTGEIIVLTGTPRGSSVPVWTDAAGDLTGAPLTPAQVADRADTAAIGAIAGVGVLYLSAAVAARRVLTRRRIAAWHADWEVTARMWSRQSW